MQQKPELSVSAVTSGSYMDQYEKYQADQFMGRNMWRSLKVGFSRLAGSKEENGVFIGKKGQLLEDIAVPDQDVLKANMKAIQSFSQKYSDIPVNMLLVPDAANILSDRLPFTATVADQSQYIAQVKKELGDSVQWIDAVKPLTRHSDEKIYYKTDHHWTAKGILRFSGSSQDIEPGRTGRQNIASYPITTDFNGSLASKSGCRLNEKEQIDIYVPKTEDNDVVVNYVDEQKKTASLYDSSKLNSRDKYAVYLGGNFSVVDIRTVSESNRRLLLIKDSYANSFVPFLTPYFREIVMVDPGGIIPVRIGDYGYV